MSNQPQPGFSFPGNQPQTNPYILPQPPYQNYPQSPIVPQQQYQNYYSQPVQGMGDYQNQGPGYPQTGGYQGQMIPGYHPNQQPHVSPGYPPNSGFPQSGHFPAPAVCPPGPGANLSQEFQPSVCPTAPDLSSVTPIPGYEGLTFEQTILTPPSVPDWQPDQYDRKPMQNLPRINDEEVREAVIQYASEHCCYGSAPAKDMHFRELQMISAFHYKLETFTEKRESNWKFVPYNGQPIDGPQNGRAPSPWEVMAVPHDYFANSTAKIEVPHTAFTRPCHTCVGNGRIRCEACFGNGRKQCTWCKGRGRCHRFDKEENCTSCNATGFDRCFKCTGTGQVKCRTCDARGNLKGFVELVVTWTNHTDDYISEVNCMPKDLVREVSGQSAYEEENPRVFPIVQGAEEAVCSASSNLIKKHGSAFTNERILKQRQSLRIVPIAQVSFEWKSKVDKFCVYGFEHKVYFKEYPQTCCCVIS